MENQCNICEVGRDLAKGSDSELLSAGRCHTEEKPSGELSRAPPDLSLKF